MKKIIKKIEKKLKGLDLTEKNEVLSYYEEIINERLDRGETIAQIEESIDFDDIRKEYLPKAINKRENKSIKESARSSSTLLLYLFTSPIWIPLGIVYFVLIAVLYVLVASFMIVMVTLPVLALIIPLDLISKGENFGNIVLFTGLYLLIILILEVLFYNLNRGLIKANNYFIKLFSKIVLRKDK